MNGKMAGEEWSWLRHQMIGAGLDWNSLQDRLLILAREERQAMLTADPNERPEWRAHLQGRYDGAVYAGAMALRMDPIKFERMVQE